MCEASWVGWDPLLSHAFCSCFSLMSSDFKGFSVMFSDFESIWSSPLEPTPRANTRCGRRSRALGPRHVSASNFASSTALRNASKCLAMPCKCLANALKVFKASLKVLYNPWNALNILLKSTEKLMNRCVGHLHQRCHGLLRCPHLSRFDLRISLRAPSKCWHRGSGNSVLRDRSSKKQKTLLEDILNNPLYLFTSEFTYLCIQYYLKRFKKEDDREVTCHV